MVVLDFPFALVSFYGLLGVCLFIFLALSRTYWYNIWFYADSSKYEVKEFVERGQLELWIVFLCRGSWLLMIGNKRKKAEMVTKIWWDHGQ